MNVPEGWKATQIGDLAKFTSGGTPSKSSAAYWGGIYPWISGKDLKQHYLSTSVDKLTDEGFKKAKQAPKGASLILVRGMTLLNDFPVGYATTKLSFNQDIKALIPHAGVDGLFLSYLLVGNKHLIRQMVSTAGHGTGRLDTESIKSFPINAPPFLEQKKIARILSTWDRAIEVTEKLLNNSQQQKKALMQQLLTGKKRLPGFSGKWKNVNIGNIVQIASGNSKSKFINENGERYIIDMGSISREGKLIPSKKTELDEDYLLREQLVMPKDDIGGGNIIGRVGFIDQDRKYVLGDHVYVLNVHGCDSLFLCYLINHDKVNKSLRRKANGTAQLGLGKKDVEKQPVNIPNTKEEQQKIASVLSAADKEIEILEQKLVCLRQEKKALMQQLLTGKRRVKVDEAEIPQKEAARA